MKPKHEHASRVLRQLSDSKTYRAYAMYCMSVPCWELWQHHAGRQLLAPGAPKRSDGTPTLFDGRATLLHRIPCNTWGIIDFAVGQVSADGWHVVEFGMDFEDSRHGRHGHDIEALVRYIHPDETDLSNGFNLGSWGHDEWHCALMLLSEIALHLKNVQDYTPANTDPREVAPDGVTPMMHRMRTVDVSVDDWFYYIVEDVADKETRTFLETKCEEVFDSLSGEDARNELIGIVNSIEHDGPVAVGRNNWLQYLERLDADKARVTP